MSQNSRLELKKRVQRARAERGSVFFEYIIIVFFAALLVIAVFGPKVGEKMTTEYTSQRATLYSATP
jgi:hypothetical protein